ncbi:unnamed protein product [Caretta caretta]
MPWSRRREVKKHVICLLAADGTPLKDPVEMCERAQAFYAGLFSPDPANACRVLWDKLPTVSMGNRDRLALPLTLAKFLEALYLMPTNKFLGMDGLTVEFYRMFWDVLVHRLGQVIGEQDPPPVMQRLTGLVLHEPEVRLVLAVYANDVLLMVQDLDDLVQVEA